MHYNSVRAHPVPMLNETFATAQVAELAGVSLRQLQLWDERHFVSPVQIRHRRIYDPKDVLEVMILAELRRRGFPLQKLRKIATPLRKFLKSHYGENLQESKGPRVTRMMLDAEACTVLFPEDDDEALKLFDRSNTAWHVLNVAQMIRRIVEPPAVRRVPLPQDVRRHAFAAR